MWGKGKNMGACVGGLCGLEGGVYMAGKYGKGIRRRGRRKRIVEKVGGGGWLRGEERVVVG